MSKRVRAPEATRRRILHAAFDEFYRGGYQSGSLNRIVRVAGATKGGLFHHYEGKQTLGYAVVDEVIAPMIHARWISPLARSTDPLTDLRRIVLEIVAEKCENGSLKKGCPLNNLAQEMSAVDEGFRRRLEKVYFAWRESIAAALERGMKSGCVRKAIAPRQVAAFIVAAMTGIIGTAKNAQSEELLREAGQALTDYLAGLTT